MSLSPLEATWDESDASLRARLHATEGERRFDDEREGVRFVEFLSESFGRTRRNLARAFGRR